MNTGDLEMVWQRIEAPQAAGHLAGGAAPSLDPSRGILLAVDNHSRRHLLIPATAESRPPKRHATTKGLTVSVDELRVSDLPSRWYFDLECRDRTLHPNFTAVVAEIVESLAAATTDAAGIIEAVLARWRWFWDRLPEVLSPEDVVGLFGELWFLEFWLAPVDSAVLHAWTGPSGDRHDFKWPNASVEIKATRTRSDGAAKHRIAHLDQLDDPEQGQLHLFSLRVTPDPIGAHSLNRSVDRIRKALSHGPELVHALDERLARLGYNPAHRPHYDTPLRVVAEELYRVDADFPRLTRRSFPDGVPNGVDSIAYTLDLTACRPWRVATAPGPEAAHLRNTLG